MIIIIIMSLVSTYKTENSRHYNVSDKTQQLPHNDSVFLRAGRARYKKFEHTPYVTNNLINLDQSKQCM